MPAQTFLAWLMSIPNAEDGPRIRGILSYMIQTGMQCIYNIPENGKTEVMRNHTFSLTPNPTF